MIRSYTAALVLASSLVFAGQSLAQQAAPAAAPEPYVMPPRDTLIWSEIGTRARARTVELQAGRQPDNARVVTQYREALGQIERARFDSAQGTLQIVMVRAQNNPLYRGEFAYTLARDGAFDNAANEYTRAYQMLQTNAWFLAGIAAAKAHLRAWADAAGTIMLAAQTDSAVVTGQIATAAALWFEQAGDRAGSLTWARLGAQRAPDEPMNYLRIATTLRARQDTTPEGLAAIRRYRSMRPDDKLGAALYADYLYAAGQQDSAVALITYAAQDTAYREFAAQLYLQAGRDLIQRTPRNPDSAMVMLNIGRPWANAEQRPVFANLLGRAQLLKANTALTQFNDTQLCAPARAADSLLTEVERNLQAGATFDSARTANILMAVPGAKTNAQQAVRNCRETAPAPAPARTPARRPAAPPAAPRRP